MVKSSLILKKHLPKSLPLWFHIIYPIKFTGVKNKFNLVLFDNSNFKFCQHKNVADFVLHSAAIQQHSHRASIIILDRRAQN